MRYGHMAYCVIPFSEDGRDRIVTAKFALFSRSLIWRLSCMTMKKRKKKSMIKSMSRSMCV